MKARNTDRWVTPGVVGLALTLATVIILGIVAAVTYLTARGFDPAPVVKLVADLVAAVGALATVGLQLANRATVTKVERNTSPLAPGGVPLRLEPPTEPLDGRHGRPRVPDAGRPRRPVGS